MLEDPYLILEKGAFMIESGKRKNDYLLPRRLMTRNLLLQQTKKNVR